MMLERFFERIALVIPLMLVTIRFPIFALLLSGLFGCLTPTDPVTSGTVAQLRPELGPTDVIEVRVYGEPDLTGVHEVSEAGTIRLPLVGDVLMTGKTVDEAQVEIESQYNGQYLRNAQVTVRVKEFRSRRVFVLGQVSKPGPYPYDSRMSVIAAIALAGGVTKLSDANSTVVSRKVNGETKRMVARVKDIRRGDQPDVALSPGDIIFVPESPF